MTNEQNTKTPSRAAAGQTPAASPPPPDTVGTKPKTSSWKTIAIVALCLLVVGGAIGLARNRAASADKKGAAAARLELPAVPVVAGVVTQKDVPIYLGGIGTVQAFNTVTIHARVDGQVQKIGFTEGQDVRAGDLLAQIDPDPFRTALDQTVAKKGQDEAQLANARVDLKRYADLLANEGVTQQQYDTQKALVDQFVAAVNADQASIESAKVQLAYTTIVSPIDGRTGIRQVDAGNIVHASDPNGLVVITQLKPISVVFILPEQTLASIQKESQIAGPGLPVLAFSQDNTTVLGEGKLAVIDNQIDQNSATIKLKATFPNTDLRLWPGQFVNARLLLSVRKDSVVVPDSVIQRGPEGAFVFVIKDDQTVEVRSVKVAPQSGSQIGQGETVLADGLRPGERVVVDGQYKLQAGSRVKMADAATKPDSQKPKATGTAKTDAGTKGKS